MKEFTFVIANDISVFRSWCKRNNEDHRDRKFIYVTDPSQLRGYRLQFDGPKLSVLMLHGWWDKVFHIMRWNNDTKDYDSIPNDIMEGLMMIFGKSWDEIMEEAKFSTN